MNRYVVSTGSLSGHLQVPPSKSQTLRAILFAALAHGTSTIHHPLNANDSNAMALACKTLGATIESFPQGLKITGTGGIIRPNSDTIEAGNSGIVLRFCSAIGALSSSPLTINGDGSRRPMHPLLDGLTQLGAQAISIRGDGYAPVKIRGPIKSGSARISGEDSQPVSALLIASSFLPGPTSIAVDNAGERPWVAMTLEWFERLGIAYTHNNFSHFSLKGHAEYNGFSYRVPGDISNAAFPIAAALATRSEISLGNVDMNDPQGDKELIAVLQQMGANITHKNNILHVKKGERLKGVSVDINNFVDALPILAVMGCFAEGETRISGAGITRHKECNRITCITQELKKMGADIHETADGLVVKASTLRAATLSSHHDHRMAMALTVAALGADGQSTIEQVECVSKSFPTFMDDFNKLGANIKGIHYG